MERNLKLKELGASITKAASLQTYATISLLVDRGRVGDAYQAYAYFRWVDDWLDEPTRQKDERLAFVARQTALIGDCIRGLTVKTAAQEEGMVVGLIEKDADQSSGLRSYICHMMDVMAFDAERRGRLISQAELDRYTGALSMAVTEALHYFIGHGTFSPHGPTRYLAVEGAHITHMLRDTLEDNEVGYFNIPREYIKTNGISPLDFASGPYRAWVRSRVQLAREYFQLGRLYLAQVESRRARLTGYAYMARFESVLDAIERDGYVLRPAYRESMSARASALRGWSIFWSAFNNHPSPQSRPLTAR